MEQINDANWQVYYIGGWCLNYVQRAFNAPWAGSTALDAWYNRTARKHYDRPPLGITVPVYFTGISGYDSDPGHVAIMLSDGYVASSTLAGNHPQGYLHPNLDHLIATYKAYHPNFKYVGWGEDIGGMDVVKAKSVAPVDDSWRIVASPAANVRTKATSNSPLFQAEPLDKGVAIKMAGWTTGQDVNGTNKWFVTDKSRAFMHFSNFDEAEKTLPFLDEYKYVESVEPSPNPTPEYTPAPSSGIGAIDISSYQGGVSVDSFKSIKEAGWKIAVVKTGTTGPSYGGSKVEVSNG